MRLAKMNFIEYKSAFKDFSLAQTKRSRLVATLWVAIWKQAQRAKELKTRILELLAFASTLWSRAREQTKLRLGQQQAALSRCTAHRDSALQAQGQQQVILPQVATLSAPLLARRTRGRKDDRTTF